MLNQSNSRCVQLLGWSAKERKESIAQYIGLVEREVAALDELLEVNS
jgi:hypothetical protein